VAAADDLQISRLATCQDSWLEMKGDPVRTRALGEHFDASFTRKGNSFVPRSTMTVGGLSVVEAYPESVGMGVGFSILVSAPFDRAKAAVENLAAARLEDCDTSDGMRTCGHEVGPKKTITLMTDAAGKSGKTLIGCYYYYEK
jgi:hypothetical protein